jgi:hypothetical protein
MMWYNARMAGSPIKRARREIAEQAVLRAAHESLTLSNREVDRAILKAYEEGGDPVLLMMPTARALVGAAEGGDAAAIREVFDRVSGKVAQEVVVDPMGLDDLEGALEAISERRRARMLELQGVEVDVTPVGGSEGGG